MLQKHSCQPPKKIFRDRKPHPYDHTLFIQVMRHEKQRRNIYMYMLFGQYISCVIYVLSYRRRWLLSIGAYSFSQQENERLTANMRLIGIPLINMGGVISHKRFNNQRLRYLSILLFFVFY